MSTTTWILVAVAGAVGAPLRYLLDGFVQDRVPPGPIPWGTFSVNVLGSFVLGFLTGLSMTGHLDRFGLSVLGTGLCGAFTTFSTFSFEATRLIEDGDFPAAAWTIGGSLAVGLTAAALGLAGAQWIG